MKLSIITINRNNKEGLKITIESVIIQNYKNYEYIIIDGGSTDGSIDIIKENAKKSNINWISEKDNGIFHAMNKGIEKSKGEYLLFLNSGDYLVHCEILTHVFNIVFNEDYVFGNINLIKNNTIIYKDVSMPFDVPDLSDLIKDALPHQASFIKKELFEEIGKYNEEFKISSDWEFTIRALIINNCSVKHLPLTISNYDITGISSNTNLMNHEKDKILKKHFHERVINDSIFCCKYKKDLILLQKLKSYKILYKILHRL